MKEIYIIRHADWDLEKDALTNTGRKKCLGLKDKLGKFNIVISSNFDRSKETARLLTGSEARIDNRAGILEMSEEQSKKVIELRQARPLGVAGVIFSIPELIEPVKQAGQKLIDLIREALEKLDEGGKALIISHDGTMVATEKILKEESFNKIEKTFYELEGFIIDENFGIVEL